jgi:hypothetical protein
MNLNKCTDSELLARLRYMIADKREQRAHLDEFLARAEAAEAAITRKLGVAGENIVELRSPDGGT